MALEELRKIYKQRLEKTTPSQKTSSDKTYWWVRMPDRERYERFNALTEAKRFVEEETRLPFNQAKWIGPYSFDLGLWKGPRHITLFEGDEAGQPTGRYLSGKIS